MNIDLKNVLLMCVLLGGKLFNSSSSRPAVSKLARKLFRKYKLFRMIYWAEREKNQAFIHIYFYLILLKFLFKYVYYIQFNGMSV